MALNISHFLFTAERAGLPVKMLRYVWTHVPTQLGPDSGYAYEEDFLALAQADYDDIHYASLAPERVEKGRKLISKTETRGVMNLYHEAAHAYLWHNRKVKAVADLTRRAEKYYTGARLDRGKKATSDLYRVVTEAAGSYVGHRAMSMWQALDQLHGLMMDRVTDPSTDISKPIATIIVDYQKAMWARVFGYLLIDGTQYEVVDREIPAFLRDYCDRVLLENKVPDAFILAPNLYALFKKLHNPLPTRIDENERLDRYKSTPNEDASIAGDALFDHGSDQLKADAERYLKKWADRLNGVAKKRVVITGHTDSTGKEPYNLDLSRRRAEAVQRWFKNAHVKDAGSFIVKGKGEEEPIASNNTAEGRRSNRRVEIRIQAMQ